MVGQKCRKSAKCAKGHYGSCVPTVFDKPGLIAKGRFNARTAPYAERMLDHVGLKPDSLIAYHHLNGRRKPSRYGYERCCDGRPADRGIAVGDERPDLIAADAFGCHGIFAGWCRDQSLSTEDCPQAGWTFATLPAEIVELP